MASQSGAAVGNDAGATGTSSLRWATTTHMNVRKWLARLEGVLPADAVVTVLSLEQVHALSAGEVRKPETRAEATGAPVRHGLFCTHVFGPEKPLSCGCGQFCGLTKLGAVCPACGDSVLLEPRRDTTFGHVELATPVVHPWLAPLAADALGWSLTALKQVLRGERTVDATGVSTPGEGDEDTPSGPELVLGALQQRSTGLLPDPMVVMLRTVLVLPPGLRPDGHDANDLYRRLINRNNRLRRLRELNAPHIIVRNEARMLQESIDALFDNEWRGVEPDPDRRLLRSLGSLTLEALRDDPTSQTMLRALGFEAGAEEPARSA